MAHQFHTDQLPLPYLERSRVIFTADRVADTGVPQPAAVSVYPFLCFPALRLPPSFPCLSLPCCSPELKLPVVSPHSPVTHRKKPNNPSPTSSVLSCHLPWSIPAMSLLPIPPAPSYPPSLANLALPQWNAAVISLGHGWVTVDMPEIGARSGLPVIVAGTWTAVSGWTGYEVCGLYSHWHATRHLRQCGATWRDMARYGTTWRDTTRSDMDG